MKRCQVVLSAMLLTLTIGLPAADAAKPNLVIFLSDDHTSLDSSVYGSKDLATPSMARLAAEGLTFDRAFVASPSCAPSRAAMLTGLMPARNGAEPNHSRPRADLKKLPAYLQELGYEVVAFGKVSHYKHTGEYGFDHFAHDAYHEDIAVPRALEWLRARRSSKPLCLFIGSNWPHVPWPKQSGKHDTNSITVPPNHVDTPAARLARTRYYAAVDTMDTELGQVYELARQTLGENTLFLHTSDHGAQWPFGKWNLYDDGIRTPMIAVWPGRIKAGSRTGAMVSWVDILPTLVELAGGQPPTNLDGRSFAAVLRGETNQHRDQIFTTHSGDGNFNVYPSRSVRDGRWKYILNLHPEFKFLSHVTKATNEDAYWKSWVEKAEQDADAATKVRRYHERPREELYDLVDDPLEQRNLADTPEQAGRLARMRADVEAWMKAQGDKGTIFGQPTLLARADNSPDQFINPIAEGADPWVVRDAPNERYLWCMSEGNRAISIWASKTLTSLGRRHIVWRAPQTGPHSKEVWAPELHFLDGRWHIYFAASDGNNHNHLAYVLQSKGDKPLGEYTLYGPLATGEGADGRSPNLWAIDMTVLEHAGKRYAVWSGWDGPRTDRQFLYIAPMKSPTELAGPRVRICANDDHLWERTEENAKSRGLNEGPQVLQQAGRTFLTYSCSASWLPSYKLGVLELVGADPLNPAAWRKHPKPVFQSGATTFGVGHSSFVPSMDGKEWWHVFHAKRDTQPGWRRHVFVQPFEFDANGFPDFGAPIAAGVPLNFPSGEGPAPSLKLPYQNPLTGATALRDLAVYAHHQYFGARPEGLHLGLVPENPINEFRCGEKALLAGGHWEDMTAAVSIRFQDGTRDAGLLFRTTLPSMGFDAQRGYFAGLLAGEQRAILGKTDGATWTELAKVPVTFDPKSSNRLSVTAVGDSIRVALNGSEIIAAKDNTYKAGTVGFRVVDTHASFRDLDITSPSVSVR